jgi:hypothetical protein
MKYLLAILIVLGIGGYFAYQKADGHYSTRVSGQVSFYSDGEAKLGPSNITEGEHIANLNSSTIKVGWQNAWDTWPALLAGVLAGIVVFGGLYVFTAENLINAEQQGDIERLKKRLVSEKERADSAQADARSELEQERTDAKKAQQRADKITVEAEKRILSAEQEKQRYIEQARKVVKQREQQAAQAQSDAQSQSTRKEHASAAMLRYKRKLDKLKSDDDALHQFVKQHHPDLIKY